MAKTALRIEDAMPRKVKPSHPFGERLMRLRTERGLTQTQLAERIGSTQSSISIYETVAEYPPTAVVIALAKELKVTTDELLGVKTPKGTLKTEDTAEQRRLWKQFQKMVALPERDRRAVIRLVSSLVSTKPEKKTA